MNGNSFRGAAFATLLLLTMNTPTWGENIHGRLAGRITLQGTPAAFAPEELLVIAPGTFPPFLKGIEFHVDFPEDFLAYQNNFALTIYRGLSPEPSEGTHSYTGIQTYTRLLPNRGEAFIHIPVKKDHGLANNAMTTVLPMIMKTGDFPLMVTIAPIMKGIPDEAFAVECSATLSPLWENKGSLSLRLTNPSGHPDELIETFIDGNPQDPFVSPVTLSTGFHRIRVVSSHAAPSEQTIAVEPGQQLELDWSLDYSPPELTIMIPKGILATLDGEPVNGEGTVRLTSEPGAHEITYTMGDISISRKFILPPGERLEVDLLLDIEMHSYTSERQE